MELPILDQYECGSCTACCELLGVEELSKPFFAKCEHQGEDCCKIYGNHPDSCKAYRCMWKMGLIGGKNDSPLKSGFMFHKNMVDGVEYLDVFETTKRRNPTRDQLDYLRKTLNAFLLKNRSMSVRYIRHGVKIGVPYRISNKYPQGTYNIGTCFFFDERIGWIWVLSPDEARGATADRTIRRKEVLGAAIKATLEKL